MQVTTYQQTLTTAYTHQAILSKNHTTCRGHLKLQPALMLLQIQHFQEPTSEAHGSWLHHDMSSMTRKPKPCLTASILGQSRTTMAGVGAADGLPQGIPGV